MEPKPEIPLLVLHSLPSVVSANPVEDDVIGAEGFASASEIFYKPGPKSRKVRQFSILARNFQFVQKAPPVASDNVEETKSSQWYQKVDSNEAYKRSNPDSEEKGGTVNSKVIYHKDNSEMEKIFKFQDPPKAKRGRRKGVKVSRSQQNSKRKNKVKADASKRKPKKEVKSEFPEKDNKVSSIVSSDGKIPSGFKRRFPSAKKVNSEIFSTSGIKGRFSRTGEQKVMLCEYCSEVFTRLDYLKLHMMLHTNERPYQCDLCKKSFRMRWQMRLHRKIHSNYKPYKCQFCSYCSIRKDALRAHCNNIHKNIVVCDIRDCLLEHIH